jgi:hypothetical protein
MIKLLLLGGERFTNSVIMLEPMVYGMLHDFIIMKDIGFADHSKCAHKRTPHFANTDPMTPQIWTTGPFVRATTWT